MHSKSPYRLSGCRGTECLGLLISKRRQDRVVENNGGYSRPFQARAAEELDLLPEGSVIVEMLSDYAVMREQARGCVGEGR